MRRTSLFVSAILLACLVGPPTSATDEPHLVAVYDLGASQVESERVTVALHLRLFNPAAERLENLELRIGDSVLVGEYFATFRAVSIPPGATVDIRHVVAIPHQEHELWLAGGRPKLYLVETDSEGFPRTRRIRLWRERLDDPQTVVEDSPGPVHIEQKQPGAAERP